jgi:uncharacterized heparinase superfamily protein
MLSFELSLGGQRVIVDSGVHDYEWSEERRYCRSTRAHNTVEIEGQDQAEMWGAFRVARRGYPRNVRWQPEPGGFLLSALHDGYARLPGKPPHQRRFKYREGGFLEVTDRVTASRAVNCRSCLHLHPDCRCELREAGEALVRHPARCFEIRFLGNGRLEASSGRYHPEFYLSLNNTVLTYSWTASPEQAETGFIIEPQE